MAISRLEFIARVAANKSMICAAGLPSREFDPTLHRVGDQERLPQSHRHLEQLLGEFLNSLELLLNGRRRQVAL